MRAHQDALWPTSALEVSDPLAFDLGTATNAFLGRLALGPGSAGTPVVPPTHLAALLAVASSEAEARSALPVLADLLELSHLTTLVAECFRPVVELLAASWLDRVRGGRDEWSRRVQALSVLAGAIEELWPYVIIFGMLSLSVSAGQWLTLLSPRPTPGSSTTCSPHRPLLSSRSTPRSPRSSRPPSIRHF